MHFVHQTTYHEVFQTTRCKNDFFSQLDPLKGELKPVPPWQLVLGRMETDWSHLLGMARQLLHHRSFLSIKKHHLCSKCHEKHHLSNTANTGLCKGNGHKWWRFTFSEAALKECCLVSSATPVHLHPLWPHGCPQSYARPHRESQALADRIQYFQPSAKEV